jgi:hypothetical protein
VQGVAIAEPNRSLQTKHTRGEPLKGGPGWRAVEPWKGETQGSYLVKARYGVSRNQGPAQRVKAWEPGPALPHGDDHPRVRRWRNGRQAQRCGDAALPQCEVKASKGKTQECCGHETRPTRHRKEETVKRVIKP